MLGRKDYKAIKHMDRQQMDEYLTRVYMRGYEAGMKKAVNPAAVKKDPAPEEKEN